MDNAAVEAQRAIQHKFIEHTLVPRILAANADLAGVQLVDSQVALQVQLDGYMSAIYNLKLTTQSPDQKAYVTVGPDHGMKKLPSTIFETIPNHPNTMNPASTCITSSSS